MTPLSTKLTLDAEAIASPNLVDRFTDADLVSLGSTIYEGYNTDKYSRSKWETRTAAAMDLAMQIQKDKNFPWPNCSNVAFPLVTISLKEPATAAAAIRGAIEP